MTAKDSWSVVIDQHSLSEGTQLDDLNKCKTYSLMNPTVQTRLRILPLHLRINLHISW